MQRPLVSSRLGRCEMSKSYDIPRTSQSYTLEEADAVIDDLRRTVELIEHYACLGLGSEDSEHWQAALEDIIDVIKGDIM